MNVSHQSGPLADNGSAPAVMAGDVVNSNVNGVNVEEPLSIQSVPPVVRLSPRLEMRLALNHDIMGDEDLISYDPGPNLESILGRDLSTFQKLTGKELLNRSANRIVPKETLISYCQQRNSKLDTPIPSRRKSNQSTWNSSGYVDQSKLKRIVVITFC